MLQFINPAVEVFRLGAKMFLNITCNYLARLQNKSSELFLHASFLPLSLSIPV